MILEIIKWYSITFLSFCVIANLWECIKKRDFDKFVEFLIIIPILVYVIVK